MANIKTAAEWKAAAANNQKTVDTLSSRLNTLGRDTIKAAENVQSAEQAYAAASTARANLNNPYVTPPVSPYDKAAIAARNQEKANAAAAEENAKAALTQAQNQLTTLKAQTASTEAERTKAQQSVTYANNQAAKASTGEPNTQTTAPPGNPDPGSNTAAGATPDPQTPNTQSTTATDPQQEAFLLANQEPATLEFTPPVVVVATDPQQEAFLLANQADEGTLQSQKVLTIEEQRLLEANQGPEVVSLDAPPVVVIATDPQQEAFLLANQADEGTIQAQRTPSLEEQRFLEANADVATQESIDAADNENELQRIKNRSITVSQESARSQATAQDQTNFQQTGDWRVRLSLAPESQYLYNLPGNAGILSPLKATNGVIFPYTPNISVSYNAHYDPTDVTHSNYKIYQYRNSAVENISITCDFTAQDTYEANYLLAAIHFFRTVTKMFYGQDSNPKPGTPPPLCYLTGLGAFQFDKHPLAITSFNYNLPVEVDYIRAGTTTTLAGVDKSPEQPKNLNSTTNGRLSGVQPGGTAEPPKFKNVVPGGTVEPTYVPTKIQLSISAIPIMSRSVISNEFSLRSYGTGSLLQGSNRKTSGVW